MRVVGQKKLGNGIIAAFAPRVALCNSFKGQIKSFEWTP
jgi:hypothetical protein